MSYGQVWHKPWKTRCVSHSLHPDLTTTHPQTDYYNTTTIVLFGRHFGAKEEARLYLKIDFLLSNGRGPLHPVQSLFAGSRSPRSS
jgi:hypothetical protein